MARDSSVSVYVISVAAELSSMHPQTLRNYERMGLISPSRTAGGNRMYSDDDLERLALIAELAEQGLNLAGIKMVLRQRSEISRLRAEVERLQEQLDSPDPGT